MTGVTISAGRKSSLHSVAFNDPAAMADAIMLQPSAAEQRSPRLAPHGTPRHEQGGGVHALHFAAAPGNVADRRGSSGARSPSCHAQCCLEWDDGSIDGSIKASRQPPTHQTLVGAHICWLRIEQGDQASPLLLGFSHMIRRTMSRSDGA